jgi:hypothetical protein
MPRRFRPRTTPGENLRAFFQRLPWKFFLLVPALVLVAIPAYYFGARAGKKVFPAMTGYFYNLSGPQSSPTPTPYPAFTTVLPQAGSLLYTVQEGDACDEILTYQMHMADAGTVFSDADPATIQALSATMGQNCDDLQPGEVVTLSPQYPLVALGGRVLNVAPTGPQQALPTPLIKVTTTQQVGYDCTNGCWLDVQIAQGVQVNLYIETALPVLKGSWVWADAALARKNIKNFGNYPYANPVASLNGMSMHACNLQVDNTYDSNGLTCDQLPTNTIDDDGGAWLFGVTGPSGLGHWRYPLHLPSNTQILMWLTVNPNGQLSFHNGNPVYRYDAATHLYVPV